MVLHAGARFEGNILFEETQTHPQAMLGEPQRALASMGVYVFNADFLYEQLARDSSDCASCHDFGKDLIPRMAALNRVYGQSVADSCVNVAGETPYRRDVGTVDALWEANLELTKVTSGWPVWSQQHQLSPARFMFNA